MHGNSSFSPFVQHRRVYLSRPRMNCLRMTGKSQYRVAVVVHAPVYQEGVALVLEKDARLRITADHAMLDVLTMAVRVGVVELSDTGLTT